MAQQQLSNINVNLSASSAQFNQQLAQANKSFESFSKKFGKNSSNISFQLQDIAVQAQAGTNALTIFTQQAPQLFQGFGAGGAAFGALAAFSGLLLSAFGTDDDSAISQAKEQLDLLSMSTEEFTATQKAAAVALLSDNIDDVTKKLNEQSETVRNLTADLASYTGGSAPASAELVERTKRDLAIAKGLEEQYTKELTDLFVDRLHAQQGHSKAYLDILDEQKGQNEKNLEDQAKAQQAFADKVLAINDRADQEELKASEKATNDELTQLWYRQQQELTALEAQYDEKLKKEEAYQRLVTAIVKRHEEERNQLVADQTATFEQDLFDKAERSRKYFELQARNFERMQNSLLGDLGNLIGQFSDESALAAGAAVGLQVYAALAENQLNLQRQLSGINAAVYADPTIPTVAAKQAAIAVQTAQATTLSQARAGLIVASNIAGQFHNGTDEVSSTGSYLLKAGEAVIQPTANKDLRNFLKDYDEGKNQQPTQYIINAPVNLAHGSIVDEKMFSQMLIKQRDVVKAAVSKVDRERPIQRRRT